MIGCAFLLIEFLYRKQRSERSAKNIRGLESCGGLFFNRVSPTHSNCYPFSLSFERRSCDSWGGALKACQLRSTPGLSTGGR